jgi:hypothetical protein
VAAERFGDVGVPAFARFIALAALRRVAAETVPFFGGGSATPARRAFESPMAMACFAERAPCLPARTWRTSSRTNSPACVVGDFPSRLSRLARAIVLFSGMTLLPGSCLQVWRQNRSD